MLWLLITVCLLLSSGEAGNPTLRIVRGQLADEGQFPSLVAMVRRDTNMNGMLRMNCGATVIGKKVLLTAAHCTACGALEKNETFIRYGNNDMRKGTELEVVEIECNPDGHDIAVMRVDQEFPDSVRIEDIPEQEDVVKFSTQCKIAGWGDQRRFGFDTDLQEYFSKNEATGPCVGTCRLRYADHQTIKRSECIEGIERLEEERRLNDTLSEFCTTGQNTDACIGDSGGGVFCNGKLYGVISWGFGCVHMNELNIQVWVPYFKDWIEKKKTEWA